MEAFPKSKSNLLCCWCFYRGCCCPAPLRAAPTASGAVRRAAHSRDAPSATGLPTVISKSLAITLIGPYACFQAKAPPEGMHCKPQSKAVAYTRMHNPLLVLTPVA